MPIEGTNGSGPEVLLRVPVRGAGPLGTQVETTLREAIRAGRLGPGARLPPSRTLARDLGVSRRLVVGVYEQLVAEGWLQAQVGAGTSSALVMGYGALTPTAIGEGVRRLAEAVGRVVAAE
jgi:GntR family transcriptional regulator/MocR family aminotransferase